MRHIEGINIGKLFTCSLRDSDSCSAASTLSFCSTTVCLIASVSESNFDIFSRKLSCKLYGEDRLCELYLPWQLAG